MPFPILKEFGYPYTLFLYKNYVDGGGKALTTPMIQEMINAGATIGSHSVSHPYPAHRQKFPQKGTGRLRCLPAQGNGRIQTFPRIQIQRESHHLCLSRRFLHRGNARRSARSSATPTCSPCMPGKVTRSTAGRHRAALHDPRKLRQDLRIRHHLPRITAIPAPHPKERSPA